MSEVRKGLRPARRWLRFRCGGSCPQGMRTASHFLEMILFLPLPSRPPAPEPAELALRNLGTAGPGPTSCPSQSPRAKFAGLLGAQPRLSVLLVEKSPAVQTFATALPPARR